MQHTIVDWLRILSQFLRKLALYNHSSPFSIIHDCLFISPIAGFVDDNAGSQGPYTPLSFLWVSLHLVLLLLFFNLLYTHFSLSFRQHFANTFTLSSILHSPFFSIILPDICEEEVTTTSVEMLNGGFDSYIWLYSTGSICWNTETSLYSWREWWRMAKCNWVLYFDGMIKDGELGTSVIEWYHFSTSIPKIIETVMHFSI